MNEQSISQIKLISLFVRKFQDSIINYNVQNKIKLLSQHSQLILQLMKVINIINRKTEHPYFVKPDKITKQTIVFISFDPRLITENNLIDDNRPYRYEQNSQEQQSLFTTNENYNENDNNNENSLSKIKMKTVMKLLYIT